MVAALPHKIALSLSCAAAKLIFDAITTLIGRRKNHGRASAALSL